MGAVYKREMRAYMNNLYGWVSAAVILVVLGIMMFVINLNYGLADVAYAWSSGYSEYVLILMIPILAMRSMAEDRKNKTEQFYHTLPISTASVVLGKYLALLTAYAIPVCILALYPLILNAFGNVNFPWAYTTILMYFLLGAALLAICMFLSSMTPHKLVAALLGIVLSVAIYFSPVLLNYLPYTALMSYICFVILALVIGVVAWLITRRGWVAGITAGALLLPLTVWYVLDTTLSQGSFEGLFPFVMLLVSPFYQYEVVVQKGFLDLFSVSVLLSTAVLFVFLTIQSVNKRHEA